MYKLSILINSIQRPFQAVPTMIPGQAVERFSLDDLLVDKNGLYSIKIDWTDGVKITEFPVSWIFVTGEWIYF